MTAAYRAGGLEQRCGWRNGGGEGVGGAGWPLTPVPAVSSPALSPRAEAQSPHCAPTPPGPAGTELHSPPARQRSWGPGAEEPSRVGVRVPRQRRRCGCA